MSRHEIDPSFPFSPCSTAAGGGAVAAPGGVGSPPGGVGSPPGGAGSLPGGAAWEPPGGVGSLPGGDGSCAAAVPMHQSSAAQRAIPLARLSNLRMLTSRDTGVYGSQKTTYISIAYDTISRFFGTISCAFLHNQEIPTGISLVKRLHELMSVEGTQVLDLFADADEAHRHLQFVTDAEDDAALGGAVELGEDDTSDVHGLLEAGGLGDGVLAVGGVEHQEHLVGGVGQRLAHHAPHLLELGHQVLFCVEPPRGVTNNDVEAFALRPFDGIEDHGRGISSLFAFHHRHSGALSPDLQLLGGGGAEGVAGRQQHLLAVAGPARRQLADGSGLADAVDVDGEDHTRPGAPDVERTRFLLRPRQDGLRLAADDGPHRVGVLELVARQRLLDRLEQLVGRLGADVRRKQDLFELIDQRAVDLLAPDEAADAGDEAAARLLEAFLERLALGLLFFARRGLADHLALAGDELEIGLLGLRLR